MKPETIAKALSAVLLTGGGALLGDGVISESQASMFSSAVVTIVGLGATWFASSKDKPDAV